MRDRDMAMRLPSGLFGASEVLFDELDLLCPALLVGGERFGSPLEGNSVETRFGDYQLRPTGNLLQFERDEGRGFARVVELGVDGEGMPTKRNEPHRLDAVDAELEVHPCVGLLTLGNPGVDLGRGDPPGDPFSSDEWAIEFHAEPGSEFLRDADRAPHAC